MAFYPKQSIQIKEYKPNMVYYNRFIIFQLVLNIVLTIYIVLKEFV
jgi:hypothetical protein